MNLYSQTFNRLTPQEELACFEYLSTYNRNKIILSSIPVVKHMLGKFNFIHDQEDLCSIGICEVINALDKFDYKNGGKFSTYIYKSLYFGMYEYVHRQNKAIEVNHKQDIPASEALSTYDDTGIEIENANIERMAVEQFVESQREYLHNKVAEHLEWLYEAIEFLPNRQKTAIKYVYQDDLSLCDVAKLMCLTGKGADSLIYQGKNNLKKMLKEGLLACFGAKPQGGICQL